MHTALVYDEGPGRGLGHRRRMEALADSLLQRDVEVSLSPIGSDLPETEVIVVDSYVHRADDGVQFRGRTVVAVDDLRRDLAVDIVVDAAPSAGRDDHPAAPTVLAGSQFSLVNPRLATMERSPVGQQTSSVLVATGGTDSAGHGARIADEVAAALPDAAVQIAIGPWSSAPLSGRAIPVRTSDGLSEALAAVDLVVTAGGVTMLESLALGRPTIAVVTAENQRRYVDGAVSAEAVVAARIEEAAEAAAALAADYALRSQLSRSATRLVDGRGAARVAEAIAGAH